MTADPARRRRQTRLGALAAFLLVVVGSVAAVIGTSTLRTSEAGSAPVVDARVEVAFPSTPTIAVGIVDEENRLASLVVGVLSPTGAGGSLVTIATNVDTTIGLGDTRSPLGNQPYTPGDAASVEALTIGIESILSITVQHLLILGPDETIDLVERFAPFDVDFPDDVIDADGEEVAAAGLASFDAEVIAAAFTAIDIEGSAYSHHDIDVALWTALADAASSSPLDAEPSFDADDRPVDPGSADEALDLLLSGPVAVRDLAIDPRIADDAANEAGTDFVIADRSDALLVFGEIAPGLVSTPNESLSFQIIARFTDDQVVAAGAGSTTASLMHDLITELLFAKGNIVSVQTAASVEGAAQITRLEVADKDFIDAVKEVAPVLFGEVDVVEATRLVEGVDVVAVLGTAFLERRAEIAEETSATSTTVDTTDSDAGTDVASEPELESTEPVGQESTDESDTTSDTVAADD